MVVSHINMMSSYVFKINNCSISLIHYCLTGTFFPLIAKILILI